MQTVYKNDSLCKYTIKINAWQLYCYESIENGYIIIGRLYTNE